MSSKINPVKIWSSLSWVGIASSTVIGWSERIYFYGHSSTLWLVIEAEIDVENWVGHSWRVDQKTIESIKIRASSLWAVDSWFRSRREIWFDEALHFSWVSESEGLIGLQGNKDIVRVDCGVSRLIEGS